MDGWFSSFHGAIFSTSLYFASLKELGVFELMMSLSTVVKVPMMVPFTFGIVIKKTPQWEPGATNAVGLFVSWFVLKVFTALPQMSCAALFGVKSLTIREIIDMSIILTVAGHVLITGGFFCLTSLILQGSE